MLGSNPKINITISANVVNVKQSVDQTSAALQTANEKVKQLAPSIQQATTKFGQLQGAAVSGNKAINNFAKGSEEANSKLGKFGKIFSDNRGIVFGVAGLSSALAEAVGMMGMFGDSQLRLAEAQEELNKLEEQGITSGKAHADAVSEVTKQQRFFNMVSRNTILSQMDMVFFTTMVISGLVKMNSEGGATAGMLGKLKGVFGGLKNTLSTTTNSFSTFMNSFSPLPGTLTKTETAAAKVGQGINQIGVTSAISVTKVLAFAGALAGIGLATYGVYQLITSLEKIKSTMNEVFAESIMKINLFSSGILQAKVMLGIASEEEKQSFKDLQIATELQTKAMQNLGFVGIKSLMLTDEELKMLKEEIIRLSKETKDAGNVMSDAVKDPITDWEAFNNVQAESLKMIGAAKSHFEAFTKLATANGQSFAEAKEDVAGYVAQLDLAPDIAEKLESLINEWLDVMILKEKTATDEAKKMMDALGGISTAERTKGMWDSILTGSPEALNILSVIGNATDQWRIKNADVIPVLDDVGKTTQKLTNDLTAQLTPIYGLEVAQAMATIGAELYTAAQKDAKEANDGMSDSTKQLVDDLNQEFDAILESQAILQKYGLIATEDAVANNLMASTFEDLVLSIQNESKALLAKQIILAQITDADIKAVEAAEANLLVEAQRIVILEKSYEGTRARNAAIREGVQTFSDERAAIEQNNLAAEQTRKGWVGVVNEMFPMIDTTNMLTEELKALATGGLDRTRDGLIALRREQEASVQTSLDFFDSLTGAESNKDFKEAWKKFDWGSIPKRFKDDVKDMFKDIGPVKERANEIATALHTINVALHTKQDEVGKTGISGILKELTKDLGELGKTDVAALNLKEKIFDPINNLDSKQAKSDALKKIPNTIAAIAQALDDGKISMEEYNIAMAKNAIETGNVSNLSENQRKIYDDLTAGTDKAKDSTAKYTEEMTKVEVTGLVVETIAEMWADLGEMIIKANIILQENWSETMINTAKMFGNTIVEETKLYGVFITELAELNEIMSTNWKDNVNLMIRLTDDTSGDIQKIWDDLVKKSWSKFVKLANNWEKAMKNMVTNAKVAANKIQSIMDSIKDTESVHTIRTVRVGQAEGGVWNFKQGGTVSAADGLYTTNGLANLGPFKFGDNSGGRETVAFLPHDAHKADRIMDMLDEKFGRRKSMTVVSTGGDREIIVPITINIGGEQYNFTRKYRIQQGNDLAQQVF